MSMLYDKAKAEFDRLPDVNDDGVGRAGGKPSLRPSRRHGQGPCLGR